jgi:xylan 1,4-beta-xylosidase
MSHSSFRKTAPLALVAAAMAIGAAITWFGPTTPLVHAQPAAVPANPFGASDAPPFPVNIVVDAGHPTGDLKPIYRFFGADEPNYAYMKDGMKLLGDIGKLGSAQAYFRTHNLMCTGDGTPALKWGSTNMYTEDAQGNPVYDWTIVDRIFDAYLKNGVKPYAQIGFMPKALSTHPEPYQHSWSPTQNYNTIYTGWSYPPTDYNKWRELVYQWVKHSVEKYGKDEVEKWYWEVWNEPNIRYWSGTPEEFMKLHDYAIDGVRRALPTAKVGGPDSAGAPTPWLANFFEHCLRGANFATGQIGTPIDFVSFHAKGSPSYVDANGRNIPQAQAATTPGHVRMGISNQLNAVNSGFRIVASFPELKNKPIVIGESDPDGCAACAASVYPQNGYRHTEQFASYTAAVFTRKLDLAERHGVNLEGALTWAFEFEGEPIWGGYRVMATKGGINVPAFNAIRMMGKMSGKRLDVSSDGARPLDEMIRSGVRGEKPDVSAIASLDGNKLTVMVWHYHDDYVAGPDADVSIALKGLPANVSRMQMQHYRVDHTHSNAYTAWQNMGSPKEPTEAQYAQLEKAGQLESYGDPQTLTASNGAADLKFRLPRQGVSLLVLTW